MEYRTLPFAEKCATLLRVEKAVEGLATKAREIASSKRDLETQEMALREAILEEMSNDGVTSAEECGLVFAVQNAPQKVIVTDENQIPDDYFKTTRTLDKTLVNQAVKDGYTILGTTLSNGGQTLVIRSKGRK